MGLNQQDLSDLIRIIHDNSGIMLSEDKEYLVESRLLPVSRKYSCDDIGGLVAKLRLNTDKSLLKDVLEAMTTNESFFFRDIKPFQRLTDVIIPKMLEQQPNKKSIKVWCAACSTGQEPYSVLMSLKEHAKCSHLDVEILATDLDENVLDKAKKGVYSQFEVQRGVPVTVLLKYFTQNGEEWKIQDALTNSIKFRQFNLMDDPKHLGTFDLIFCRNVLIYFTSETKERILNSMAGMMEDHSVLFLGASEGILSMDVPLEQYEDFSGVFKPNS